jgi:hypothetical protein
MPAPALEEFEHLGVVPSWAPGERVHDLVVDVVIPNTHGVRIPPRTLRDFRRRPLTDTGHDPQPGRRLSRREAAALLESSSHRRRSADRALPREVDPRDDANPNSARRAASPLRAEPAAPARVRAPARRTGSTGRARPAGTPGP